MLHNGYVHPSIPLAHSVHLKVDYVNVKLFLTRIKYDWNSYAKNVVTSKIWVYYLEYKEDILNTHVSYVCWIAELTMNTINVEYAQIKREILTPGSHNIFFSKNILPSEKRK